MKKAILILTNSTDKPVEKMIDRLTEIGERVYRFNTETFPSQLKLELSYSSNKLSGFLESHGKRLDIDKIKTVWYRRPKEAETYSATSHEAKNFIREESKSCLWSLYTSVNAAWLNHPLTLRLLNRNKLYQLKMASFVGFKIPNTIITNDPVRLLEFCKKQGGYIAVKTIHPTYIRSSKETLGVYTNQISAKEVKKYFSDIHLAPVLAQEYIQKCLELRITVVGDKIFSCAIHSQNSEKTKHDWRRYDFTKVKHEKYSLPNNIKAKLLNLMRICRLNFGAVDMILTPSKEHVFLEINPNGEWDWIEVLTGMPISQSLAQILANPKGLVC